MKIRFMLFVALVSLTFVFINSVKAQTPSATPQVYQGCASGPFTYRYPSRTFIWNGKDSEGRMITTRIDRVVTSEGRMVLTFVPERVVVEKDTTLNLEAFSFGRETPFGKTDLQNPSALKSLKLPPIAEMPEFKKSTIEEERYQYMNWDGTPLETVRATGDWYAIIHRKSDFSNGLVPNILPVTSPENYLNQNSIPTSLIPPTFYYYGDELVKVAGEYDPNNKEKIPVIPSAIRLIKLTPNSNSSDRYNLALATTELEIGEYYVTLQSTAAFGGQTSESCSKTTPPVLIRVKPRNTAPELTLTPKSDCSPTVVAEASDKDLPAQKLTIKGWRILDQQNNDVTSSTPHSFTTNSDKSQTLTINEGAKVGKYRIEARVSDGLLESEKVETTVEVKYCGDRPPPTGKAAGIAYFGNATPDYRNEEIISNPEIWTKDTERKRPAGAGAYPSKEYEEFYIVTTVPEEKPEIPILNPEKNNTDTINRIVNKLQKHPNSNLYVLGYADYRFTPGVYKNELLAEFRIKSVIEAIKKELSSRGLSNRIIGAGSTSTNCAASTDVAQKNRSEKNIWSDLLRWDRRVEIIYVSGDEKVIFPSYARNCDVFPIDLSR